jgi:hypothetical protein
MQMKLLLQVALGLLPSLCVAKGEATGAAKQQPRGFFFTENVGQITDPKYALRPDIDFNLASGNFVLFVGDAKLHYQFNRTDNAEEIRKHHEALITDPKARATQAEVLPVVSSYRVDVELVGANKNAVATTEDRHAYYEMFYNDHSPNTGSRANTFGKVTYKDVYPNIDWVLYSKDGQFKYEFVVRQGGNPSDIKLKYSGPTTIALNSKGGLGITTPMGNINDDAPYSFDGTGRTVKSAFVLNGDVLSFNVGEYSGTLTIDPAVTWGTYYGSSTSTDDQGWGVSAAADGSTVYLSGITFGTTNISTTGSHQQTFGGSTPDGFLVQFNASGVRQWGTFIGGNSSDYLYGCATDPSGNVVVGGYTNTGTSVAFASTGCQQPTYGGSSDGWVAKFNSAGVRQWGTYLGGSNFDRINSVACDAQGNIAVGGETQSSNNISTPFAQQPSPVSIPEGFIVKYNSAGARVWGTYLGGGSSDAVYAVAFDMSGHVYSTGYTYSSTNISSTGSFSSSINSGSGTCGSDAFVVKLDATQGTRLWGTYYGGAQNCEYEQGWAIATDDSNAVYMVGYASATSNIATSDGFQPTIGGSQDLFIVKFDSAGARKWASYMGGSQAEYISYGNNISVDINGNVYFGGHTTSSNNIADNGMQNSHGNTSYYDAFVEKFKRNGTRDWGSYYGGTYYEYLAGIATDQKGNVYLAGYTSSTNQIATTGAHLTAINTNGSYTGYYDAFLAKILDCALPNQPGTITGSTTVCQGSSQTYTIAAVSGATTYQWILPPGWTGTSTTTSITVIPSSTSGTVRVKAGVSCGFGPARSLAVTALPAPTASITPSGPTTFCAGANVTLTANTGTGFTYVWKQGTTTLGTTSNAHVASTSGNYTVLITGTNSCTTTSAITAVVVNPNPVINFPATPATCTNNPLINLSATPTGGTYTGAGVSGTTMNPMVAGPGIHTVVYSFTDNNGCSSQANQSQTVNPAPVISFPALSTICSDIVLPLNMATPPGGTYTGTGVSGSNFNPGISGIGTFNITYTYTDGNNCTASGSQPQTVNPVTSVNFPSITPKCIDANVVTLMANPTGGTFSGPGVTGNQFTPSVAGAGSQVVHYDYTNTYGCVTHDSETIVVNNLPVLNFPALNSVCNNAPVTMMATPTGGTYSGPGTGTGNILNTTNAGVGTHLLTYNYTDANTCSNSIQQFVTVDAQPVITSQPALYIEICDGEALAVSVGATNAGTYQWQQYSVNIAGANTNTFVVDTAHPVNSGNYQVVVTGTGACASTSLISGTSGVLVNPLPSVNLTPGSTAICLGDTLMLNSGLSGGMFYQWKESTVNIQGATSSTYGVSDSGSYSVMVTDQITGCNALSTVTDISVNPSPDATVTYSGPTTFCQGEDLLMSNADIANGVTYQWTNNNNNIPGANTATYTANATGTYNIVLTNSYNCVRTSADVVVTVNPLPTPGIIVLDGSGNMTVDQTYTYYQWNLNGNAINGANSQQYQGVASGSYTVTVRDSNGCENTSGIKNPTGVKNVANGNNFVLYPNPNAGTFTIDGIVTSTDGKIAVEIVDATGKLVYKEEMKTIGNKLNTQVNINHVAAGAYMIRIVSDNAREVIPFVKR